MQQLRDTSELGTQDVRAAQAGLSSSRASWPAESQLGQEQGNALMHLAGQGGRLLVYLFIVLFVFSAS